MSTQRSIIAFAASAFLSLTGVTATFAHAHLVRAVPAAGGTLHNAPNEVTLRFSEKLEPKFSSIVVRDSTGKQVDKGDATVDKADRMVIRVPLQPWSLASTRSNGRRSRRTPIRSAAISLSRSPSSRRRP